MNTGRVKHVECLVGTIDVLRLEHIGSALKQVARVVAMLHSLAILLVHRA